MKKFILGIVIGGIVFGTIGSVVAYNYNAKDISYTPNDNSWNVNNVEDALKDLNNIRNKNSILNHGAPIYAGSIGAGNSKIGAITLTKGNYLLSVFDGYSAGRSSSSTSSYSPNDKMISCENNNCDITKISGQHNYAVATSTESDNQYHYISTDVSLYFVKVNGESDTISTTLATGIDKQWANRVPIFATFTAIPID